MVTNGAILISDSSTASVETPRRLNRKGDVVRSERSNKTRVDERTCVGMGLKTGILMVRQEEVYR